MFVRTYPTVNVRPVNFLYMNYISRKYSYSVIPIMSSLKQNKHELLMDAYIRGERNRGIMIKY